VRYRVPDATAGAESRRSDLDRCLAPASANQWVAAATTMKYVFFPMKVGKKSA
jgi:hypothetical protein